MAKVLTVEPDKCSGCGACELACSMSNAGEFNPVHSRIQVVSFAPDFFRVPVVCLQCYRPPCAEICPTGAITRDETSGVVRVSPLLCNGCRMCEEACPSGAIFFSEAEQKAVKCELCNGEPQCARFCSTNALTFQEAQAALYDKRRAAAEKLKQVFRPDGRPGIA